LIAFILTTKDYCYVLRFDKRIWLLTAWSQFIACYTREKGRRSQVTDTQLISLCELVFNYTAQALDIKN